MQKNIYCTFLDHKLLKKEIEQIKVWLVENDEFIPYEKKGTCYLNITL